VFRSRNLTGIWDTSWAVSDVVTLQAYLSITDFRTNRYSPVGQGNVNLDGTEYIAEPFIRFHGPNDRFSGFIAAYVFRTSQSEATDLFGGGAFRDRTKTTAVFGEATGKVTDELTVVLGARYEEEKRRRQGAAGPFIIDFDKTYKEFLPKATVSYRASEAVTVGVTAGRGYNGGGAGFTFFPPFVSYQYDAEYVWNYEAFIRASLLDGRLTVTGNVFYNDYDGLQLPFTLAVNSTVIRNAEKASTYGAEFGASYRVLEHSEVFANIGVLKTKVNRYTDPLVQGNDLPRSPAFTSDVGFTYSPDGRLELTGDVRFTDAYYSDSINDPRGKTDPYAVFNARVAYPVGPVTLSLSGQNLFDSQKPIALVAPGGGFPAYATVLHPRTVTAGVEIKL
jgi:outer membrane receptor protein involved in Fe transport